MGTRDEEPVRGRAWHALTAVVAACAVVFQLVLVINGAATLLPDEAPSLATRLLRFVSYFTILSNVLIAVTAGRAARGLPDVRSWRVLRLASLSGIAVTGLVHVVLLRPLLDLDGASYVADKLLHVVVPLLAVAGWLAYGPRGLARRTDLLPSLIYPVAWLAWTLAAGAVTGWYPYPFLDVGERGYVAVAATCVGVAALFAAILALAVAVDPRLPGERLSPASSGTTPRRPTGRT